MTRRRSGRWHIVGGGLAGLAAATAATADGARVTLWEATRAAGGRCRSFIDRDLDLTIDNGNHLLLSGNRATLAYLDRIGARDRLHEIRPAAFPFVDLKSGERWTVRPGAGPVPWWLFAPQRRPPGVALGDLLRDGGRVLTARRGATGHVLAQGEGYRRFWEPLLTAVLNTAPATAELSLMRPVLLETLGRGERWCRPLIARRGLGDALVDPALEWLQAEGASCQLGARVEAIELEAGRATTLRVAGEAVELGDEDKFILATPPWVTAALVPGLEPPTTYAPIVNAHFKLRSATTSPSLLGLVGGVAEWIFRRAEVVSVTISAAERFVDRPADELAARIWADVQAALELGEVPLPRYRIVKEKRATPLQTPEAAARRWPARTSWRNLALAGDWIATGLPATIESAVRSGHAAVRALQA